MRLVLVLALALVPSACSRVQGQPAPPGGMPPAPVATVAVQPVDLPIEFEYTGQTLGKREVEVRPRVPGIVLKRNYEEGAPVKAGQSLFTIDPAPLKAVLARAEADVAAGEARLAQAQREKARLAPLYAERAVSQKEHDDAASAADIAGADVKAARARLAEARLNLGYTRVEAPIAGVAGRAQRPEGSFVSGPDVLLTTISQTDPMQVIFGLPDADRRRLEREAAAGRLRLPPGNHFDVQLSFADGTPAGPAGKLDFADLRVDPATGTSEARAEVPNPKGRLRTGQFVRVRLKGAVRTGALKVPQRAVLDGPQGKFVYVVADGKAQPRPVQVGEWVGDGWIVEKGIAAGDRVIVDGVMKIGPGAPVAADAAPAGAPPAPPK